MVKLYLNGIQIQNTKLNLSHSLEKIVTVLLDLPKFHGTSSSNQPIADTLLNSFGRKIIGHDKYHIANFTVKRTVLDLADNETIAIGGYKTTGIRLKQQAETYTLSYIEELADPVRIADSFTNKYYGDDINPFLNSSTAGRHWSNLFQKHNVVVTCEIDVTVDEHGNAITLDESLIKTKNVLCGVADYDVSALGYTEAHFGDFLRLVKRRDGISYFHSDGTLTYAAYELYQDAMSSWKNCPNYRDKYILDVETLIYDLAVQHAHSLKEWFDQGVNVPQGILEGVNVFGTAFTPAYQYAAAIGLKKALYDIEQTHHDSENAYGFDAYIVVEIIQTSIDIFNDVFANNGSHPLSASNALEEHYKKIFDEQLKQNQGFQTHIPILLIEFDSKIVSVQLQKAGYHTGQKDARDLWEYGQCWETQPVGAEEDTVCRTTAYLINHHQLNPRVIDHKRYKVVKLATLGLKLPRDYLLQRQQFQNNIQQLKFIFSYNSNNYFINFSDYKKLPENINKSEREYLGDYILCHPYAREKSTQTGLLTRLFDQLPNAFWFTSPKQEVQIFYHLVVRDLRDSNVEITGLYTHSEEYKQKIDQLIWPRTIEYLTRKIYKFYYVICNNNYEFHPYLTDKITFLINKNITIEERAEALAEIIMSLFSSLIQSILDESSKYPKSEEVTKLIETCAFSNITAQVPYGIIEKRLRYISGQNNKRLLEYANSISLSRSLLEIELGMYKPENQRYSQLDTANQELNKIINNIFQLTRSDQLYNELFYTYDMENRIKNIFKTLNDQQFKSALESQPGTRFFPFTHKGNHNGAHSSQSLKLSEIEKFADNAKNIDELSFLFFLVKKSDKITSFNRPQNALFSSYNDQPHEVAISYIIEKAMSLVLFSFADHNRLLRLLEIAKPYTDQIKHLSQHKQAALDNFLLELSMQDDANRVLLVFSQITTENNILRLHQKNILHKFGDTTSFKIALVESAVKVHSTLEHVKIIEEDLFSKLFNELQRCYFLLSGEQQLTVSHLLKSFSRACNNLSSGKSITILH